jgi:hypothetical protein
MSSTKRKPAKKSAAQWANPNYKTPDSPTLLDLAGTITHAGLFDGSPKLADIPAAPFDSAIIPARVLSIYFASKTDYARLGLDLAGNWTEFNWTARWPNLVGKIGNTDPTFCNIFWDQDVEDIHQSDVVLVYSQPNDVLRGALVEAGIGLGSGKKVVVVGENKSYGSWQYHDDVIRAKDLTQARQLLRCLAF